MSSDRENSATPDSGTNRLERKSGTTAVWLGLVVAFILVATAIGFRRVALTDTDVPDLEVLRQDAREIYLPASRGVFSISTALAGDHAFGQSVWKLFWLRASGLVDARILGSGEVALWAVALSALVVALARAVSLRAGVILAIGALGVAFTPAWLDLVPAVPAAWSAALVIFTSVHFALMARCTTYSWRWWLGLAAGVVNVVLATEGIASAASVVLWSLLARARNAGEPHQFRGTLIANTVLFADGLALAFARGPAGDAAPFLDRLFSLASWPLGQSAWAALVWVPSVWCVFTWFRRHRSDMLDSSLALHALWSVVQVVVIAAIGVHDRASSVGVLLATIAVNAACFAVLPTNDRAARTRVFVFVGGWVIAIGVALVNPRTDWENILFGRTNEPAETVTRALRRAVLDGVGNAPITAPGLSADGAADLAALLESNELRGILPLSVRPALPLVDSEPRDVAVFSESGVPEIPGRPDGTPAVGSRSPDGGATGEFVSMPLKTRFPLLQLRVAGDLRPPLSSLVLRTADGREIAPFEAEFSAEDRWKTVNFAAPAGEFRVVARERSATSWLAFSAPVEMGRLTWMVRKLPRLWPWFAAAGFAVIAFSAFVGARRWRSQRRSAGGTTTPLESLIAWPVVPWVLLFGYAAYFTYNVDPTAGPNDSGGYLNSAKLLAHGHITATPRMIDGPSAGETEILPYIPATFLETRGGELAPTYPVGLPLIFAAASTIVGIDRAVPLVIMVQLLLGVLFTRRLAHGFGLPQGWAWFAAGVVALSPLYLFQGLEPLSDSPALVWVTAAVMWAWSSREKPWHAVLAGFATALAVLIRPSNVFCALPVFLCLAGHWRQVLLWLAGGFPGAVWLLWYQHELYRNAFTTGYGDLSSLFGLNLIVPTLGYYATWLPVVLTPVVWLAFVGPFLPSIPLRVRLVLTSWTGVFLGFYATYACTRDSWFNTRFVLPAVPTLVALMVFVVQRGLARFGVELFDVRKSTRSIFSSAAVVVVFFGLLVFRCVDLKILFWVHANRAHAVAARWVRDHVPANAVIFANYGSGPLMFYSDLVVVNLDQNRPDRVAGFFERLNHSGRPVYALTYHWEGRGYVWDGSHGTGYPTAPGTWERIATLWYDEAQVWIRRSPQETAVGTK